MRITRQYLEQWKRASFPEKHGIISTWFSVFSSLVFIVIAIATLNVAVQAERTAQVVRRRMFLETENELNKVRLKNSIEFFNLSGDGQDRRTCDSSVK